MEDICGGRSLRPVAAQRRFLIPIKLDLRHVAQILEALRTNNCVNEVVISAWHPPYPDWDPDSSNLFHDLASFLRTTEHVKAVSFDVLPGTMNVISPLVDGVIKNPLILELGFDSNIELSTEEVTKVLHMSSLRKLSLSLHSALDGQVIADAFGANRKMENLDLCDAKDWTVVEAVLPRLTANPSLIVLAVAGIDRIRSGSNPASSLAYMATIGHTLGAALSLKELILDGFVFTMANLATLISGLKACQSISILRIKFSLFSNDGCCEAFATFMRSINATNPSLKHLEILGCSGQFLPSMLAQAPLRILELTDHIAEFCQACMSDPVSVMLQGLIVRCIENDEWATLVELLPAMKSLRELTVTQMHWSCNRDLIVRHMRNHWNLQTVVLRVLSRDDDSFLDEQQQRLIDAFGMRNTHIPSMLNNPLIQHHDDYGPGDEMPVLQDQEGKVAFTLFPCLFQTARHNNSPHILLIGLLSAGDAIGSAARDKKRSAI
jgi:hypothetical protein